MRSLESCDVCGAPTVTQVATVIELEPEVDKDGKVWARFDMDRAYALCEEHTPPDRIRRDDQALGFPESVMRGDQSLREFLSSLGLSVH
jgi:hypothetical protein